MPKYAQYNPAVTTIQPVSGWYDTDEFNYPNLPSITDLVLLTDAEWTARFQTPFVLNGALVAPPAPTAAQLLSAAQTAQIATLNQACQAAIIGGFLDSVTGLTITLSATDQTNALMAAQTAKYIIDKSAAWVASAVVPQYETIVENGVYYIAMVGGTTGATIPTFPTAFQTPVTDGTVQWAMAGQLVGTTTGNVWQTPQNIVRLFQIGNNWVSSCRAQYVSLKAQVLAATTVSAVQAIIW
ncbi:MAG: hypothetical protein ACYC4K_01275 [Thiobacillus sp.]